MGRRCRRDEQGFTLIETVIAIMLLMIVMAVLAPMFMGTFRATATTNARSTATSLAVEASEQLRAYPYYELGYYSSHQPGACSSISSLNEVNLDSTKVTAEPLYTLVTQTTSGTTTTTVNNTQYTITRCVYWVDSLITNDTQAYKRVIITVSWPGQGKTLSISQSSLIYPGGEGPYSYGQNDQIPTGSSGTTCSSTPNQPTGVTAKDDTTAPTNTIDVSWTAPTPTPDYYVVYAESTSDPGNTAITSYPTYSTSPETTATSENISVGAGKDGTTYWIQVQAFLCGNFSPVSQTVSATTQGTDSTTCSLYNLGAIPTGATGAVSSVAVQSNGNLADYSANTFSLTLSASNTSYCQNVYVAYVPGGGTPTACNRGSKGCSTDWVPMTAASGGSFGGSAGISGGEKWSQTGLSFVVYIGQGSSATQYTPTAQANVSTCAYSSSKGSTCT